MHPLYSATFGSRSDPADGDDGNGSSIGLFDYLKQSLPVIAIVEQVEGFGEYNAKDDETPLVRFLQLAQTIEDPLGAPGRYYSAIKVFFMSPELWACISRPRLAPELWACLFYRPKA